MKFNVGGIDRIARILVGGGMVAATYLGHLPTWGYAGAILLATGLISVCPFYLPFGWSTKK